MNIELSRDEAVDIMMKYDVLGEGEHVATRALVEYLSAYEDESGEAMSLDPVALRCAFAVYTLSQAVAAWDIDTSGVDGHERGAFIVEWLQERTTVIVVDDVNIIVEEF
jgi:hypothetical protein